MNVPNIALGLGLDVPHDMIVEDTNTGDDPTTHEGSGFEMSGTPKAHEPSLDDPTLDEPQISNNELASGTRSRVRLVLPVRLLRCNLRVANPERASRKNILESNDKAVPVTFGEWFHLHDLQRATFELDPERGDARFWCGEPQVQETLKKALFDGLDRGVPQLILYGEYGTGKTHALRHCEWLLKNDPSHQGVHMLRIEWAGFGGRTRFVDLYRETMGRLGLPFISSLMRDHFRVCRELEIPQHLIDALGQDTDMRTVLRRLARLDALPNMVQLPDAAANLGWRWLTGHALNQSERKALNVSASLVENANPARLVALLQLWGHLLQRHQNKKLLLLYDEAEQAHQLQRNRDALNSFTSATRALFDRSQKDIGILLAFYATDLYENDLIRPDTHSRLNLTEQVIQLGVLATTASRRDFLGRVLAVLVEHGQPKYHPFEQPAFEYFAEHCEKLLIGTADDRKRLLSRQGEPTPRTVLVAMASVTRAAYNVGERRISVEFMNRHFPRLRKI